MAITTEIPRRKDRQFVKNDFVVSNFAEILPYFDHLLQAPLDTVEQVITWLKKMSELEFVLNEDKAWRYINMTCDTENVAIKERYQFFIREILPTASLKANELLKKLYESKGFALLDPEKFKILIRSTRNNIEMFRKENVPLLTEINQTARKFDETVAQLHIVEKGEKITLQKAASLLEKEDRAYREKIWNSITKARFAFRDQFNSLFGELIRLRHQVAINAGFDSFADYKFIALERFDYSKADCFQFHQSIETAIKPLLERRSETRKQNLGLDVVRHWDLSVDELGKPPLQPFRDTDELIEKTIRVFERLDEKLGKQIRIMKDMGHLDLGSRLGKAPGGYNYPLPESGVPFIFMNAVGTQGDLTTMLHEAGHAIHSFATRHIDVSMFKYLPSEVAELASMSMELIMLDFLDEFYEDPVELRRAKREQIIRPLSLLPWIASVDAFQFWVYDNPLHNVTEREAAWTNIYKRFHGNYVSWDGFEDILGAFWQKQGHIFDVPFYYIEYGMAQLGAIAVWRNYRKNPKKGLADYLKALSLGYTCTIPEIYAAAGVRFDFSEEYIRELMEFVNEELKRYE
ncbi:MAG TPA: M3 family oligoendopeptidase [Bacteroidetes bacterium]|nr:M3 family oligoendopeptidase [Bacteroidota bacterium]